MKHIVTFELSLPKSCECGDKQIKQAVRYLLQSDLGFLLANDDVQVSVRKIKIKDK